MTRSELLERAKPILFNTDMVRAIQDGTKTVTRRIIKPKYTNTKIILKNEQAFETVGTPATTVEIMAPYKVGDILYVRETWKGIGPASARDYVYKADDPLGTDKWHPSIHMPKEAARVFLRVTNVRVERLQDIDDDGVVAEGLEIGAPFDELWDSTIKKSDRDMYGWAANPWVWVIEFEVMEVTE